MEAAVAYFSRFLPYLVGKRAAAPDGAKVVFRIGARPPVAVEVAGGRGRRAADPGDATVDLAVPVATFAALAGGVLDAWPIPSSPVISGSASACWSRWPSCPRSGPVPGSCWPGSAGAALFFSVPSCRCAIAASARGQAGGRAAGLAA